MATNTFGAKIVDYRFIGKSQLNADDLGGAECSTWLQYRRLCDNIVLSAWDRMHGRGVDSNVLGMSVAGLFELFGVEAKPTPEYQNRLMVATIVRKGNKSDALKNAEKAMRAAKDEWENALADEDLDENDNEVVELKTAYEECKATVDQLYREPGNYWFDLMPMLDKSRIHATDKARKAIEDIIADIIAERDLMTIEELQAEAQRLADERKGRAARKKAEAKAQADAE